MDVNVSKDFSFLSAYAIKFCVLHLYSYQKKYPRQFYDPVFFKKKSCTIKSTVSWSEIYGRAFSSETPSVKMPNSYPSRSTSNPVDSFQLNLFLSYYFIFLLSSGFRSSGFFIFSTI